jgi:hypothetical protein
MKSQSQLQVEEDARKLHGERAQCHMMTRRDGIFTLELGLPLIK